MLERLLIVGLGSIGTRHLRIIRQLLPNATVSVLRRECDALPVAGVDHCVTTVDAALRLRPEAAVIANPASRHLEYGRPLADAGVHLLIEKPIAHATSGVAELIQECRTRGCVLMTGYNLRFSPSLQFFAREIRDGRIGVLVSVKAEVSQYLPEWRPGADYRRSVSARAELGGGVLLELSHEIDYLRWILGEVQWVEATVSKESDLEIDVEDTAHLNLGFAGSSGEKGVEASLDMEFGRRDTTRTCVVTGARATLRWDGLRGSVEVREENAGSWMTLFEHEPERDETYLGEWRNFLDSIAGHSTPTVTGEDGLETLRVIEAARESSARREIMPITHASPRALAS